ncbi:MAG: porin [Gammaproteobacteria bacterium]|nr:porin [Gammaproteobacteria bacterium]
MRKIQFCFIVLLIALAASVEAYAVEDPFERARQSLMAIPKMADPVDPHPQDKSSPAPAKPAKTTTPTETELPAVQPESKKKNDAEELIKIGGRIQIDARRHQQSATYQDPSSTGMFVSLRRARLDARGELSPKIKYKTSIEMADKVKAKDLYIKVKLGGLTYEGGQFSYPLGSENISSSRYYEFVEPSILSETFSGSRDRGLLVLGNALDKRLFFSAGVVNGTGDNTPDRNNSMDFVGQAQGLLYEEKERQLTLWVGGSFESGIRDSSESESVEIAPETESGFALFAADLPNDQAYKRMRYDVDAKVLFGSATLAGEFLNGVFTYENQATVRGGYVFASYFLTGEQRTVEEGLLERQKIKNPVDTANGIGAWEVALRYSWFEVDDNFFTAGGLFDAWEGVDPEANARRGTAWTLGVNWYPTSKSRVMLNYIKTVAQAFDEEAGAYTTLSNESAMLLRLQVEY